MLLIHKRCFTALAFILLTTAFYLSDVPSEAYCAEENLQDKLITEESKSGEVRKIQEGFRKYTPGEANQILKGFNAQDIITDAAKGQFEWDLPGILKRVLVFLFKELYMNIGIMVKLIVLIALCAILRNLQTSFMNEGAGEMAFYACYIVVVTVIIISFNTAIGLSRGVVDSMVGFMYATVPVMVTLLASGGNFTSAAIFQPVIIMIAEVTATIIKNMIIPMILFSTVLSIVDNISDKIQISKLAGFIKQICTWTMGIMLTLFAGVISIQGSMGAVVDGVTSKTAKFAIGAFIPVVGKYLADAADAVVGCTLLVKNAAGIAVMVGVIAVCIVPLLKILALIVLYKMTCVLVEPISEKRITNCINEIAGSLTYLLGIAASVTFMFLVTITAIISAGNMSAMIR